MYHFVALILLLAFNHISTSTVSAVINSSFIVDRAPITLITGSNGEVNSFSINSQLIKNALAAQFANPPATCQTGLSKRNTIDCQVLALTENTLTSFSNDQTLTATLVMFPTTFPSLIGDLAIFVNQAASFVSTRNLFKNKAFTGPLVHAIIGITLVAAYQYYTYHAGLLTITIPEFTATSTLGPSSTSSCPSLTVNVTTSSTITLSTIAVPCTATKCEGQATTSGLLARRVNNGLRCAPTAAWANCPCLKSSEHIAYDSNMDPDTWNANQFFFEQQYDSPLCWPNSWGVQGARDTWCVCMQTKTDHLSTGTMTAETMTGNSSTATLTEALFPTMTVPTQSACAYSAFDQLPKGQYTPPTITPAPKNCVSTQHIVSATLTSTSCTCDYNQNVELTSWILSGQPTTQCKTGQTPPAGAITADPSPFGIIRNPDWSIGFYAGTTCGQTPYPTFGASMSGTTWKACQNLPQTTYGGQVSIAIQEWSNLCVLLHLEYGCRDEAYRYCTPTTGCVGNFGSNPRNSNRPYSIAAWQVVTTAKQT